MQMVFATNLQNSSGGIWVITKQLWTSAKHIVGGRLFITPHFGLLQQGRVLTFLFLPIKKIIEANFILPHKLQGCLVLCLSSGMKVVEGTWGSKQDVFLALLGGAHQIKKGFYDETGEPRRKILTSCTLKRQFRWNESQPLFLSFMCKSWPLI